MRGENRQKVLEFIRASHPGSVTTADIVRRTGVSQPQVYQITRALMESGLVRAARDGRRWRYSWNAPRPGAQGAQAAQGDPAEAHARRAAVRMGALFGAEVAALRHGPGVFVLSGDGVAGFALHFAAPQGRVPPTRLAVINGHLWLLERSEAERLCLVLGGDEETARAWAQEHAALCLDVDVFFLPEGGEPEALTG